MIVLIWSNSINKNLSGFKDIINHNITIYLVDVLTDY